MIFKVHEPGRKPQTFEGFRALGMKERFPAILAGVWFEGNIDLFELDQKNLPLAMEELRRYYRSEFSREINIVVYRNPELHPADLED